LKKKKHQEEKYFSVEIVSVNTNYLNGGGAGGEGIIRYTCYLIYSTSTVVLVHTNVEKLNCSVIFMTEF